MEDDEVPEQEEFEGQPIDLAVIKFTGAAVARRPLREGEKVIVTMQLEAGLPRFKRIHGGLIKEYSSNILTAIEPGSLLGQEIEIWLNQVADLGAQPKLQFDEDNDQTGGTQGEEPGAEYGESNP